MSSNDFQSIHPHNAWHSSQGIAALVNAIRQAPIEPDMPIPPVLIVAPPPFDTPKGPIAPKFASGEMKCGGLAMAYQEVAKQLDCYFFDAGTVTAASRVDGVHLDADQHRLLAQALVDVVKPLL